MKNIITVNKNIKKSIPQPWEFVEDRDVFIVTEMTAYNLGLVIGNNSKFLRIRGYLLNVWDKKEYPVLEKAFTIEEKLQVITALTKTIEMCNNYIKQYKSGDDFIHFKTLKTGASYLRFHIKKELKSLLNKT